MLMGGIWQIENILVATRFQQQSRDSEKPLLHSSMFPADGFSLPLHIPGPFNRLRLIVQLDFKLPEGRALCSWTLSLIPKVMAGT